MIKTITHRIDKYNDIPSWDLWRRLKNVSFGSFQLSTSLLFTLVFYLPFLGDGVAYLGFLYLGDQINLWVPQLFNTITFNKDFFGPVFWLFGYVCFGDWI